MGSLKPRTKGQLVAGSLQPWSGRYPVGTGSPHMREEWEQQVLTGHLEPGGHRVTEWQLGASQDCWLLCPLPMSLTNGKVLRISFLRSHDSCWGSYGMHLSTYINNCHPNAVRLLSSTRPCNANSVGRNWKSNKKMFHSNLSPRFTHNLKTSSRFLSLLFPSWTFSATSHISLSQAELWASAMCPEKEETLRCSTNLTCGLALPQQKISSLTMSNLQFFVKTKQLPRLLE